MTAYATRLDRSNPIRVAVVGAGRMGRRHIAAAAHAAGVELAAVCDPAPGRAPRPAAPPGRRDGPARSTSWADGRRCRHRRPDPLHAPRWRGRRRDAASTSCRRSRWDSTRRRSKQLGERAAAAGRVFAVGFWRRIGMAVRRGPPPGRRGRDRHANVPALVAGDADLPPLGFGRPGRVGRRRGGLRRARGRPGPVVPGLRDRPRLGHGHAGRAGGGRRRRDGRGAGSHHGRAGGRDRPGPHLRLRRRRPHRDPGPAGRS